MEADATALHVRLLRDAASASRTGAGDNLNFVAESGGLFLRIVGDLRRMHSHIATLAYPVLNRSSRSSAAALLDNYGTNGQV